MNKIILTGNLVKDVEIKTTNSDNKVATFSLAVKRDKENTDFFNCTAWNKLAELMEAYTQKGSKIAVVGRLQNRSWDKPDGTKGYSTDVLIQELELLGSKE